MPITTNPVPSEQVIELRSKVPEYLDNNTWDSSGDESVLESTTSGGILTIKSSGVCGLFERLPLSAKLCAMIFVSLVGMVILAIFLLVTQSIDIHSAKQTTDFDYLATEFGDAIFEFQDERDAAISFLIGYGEKNGTGVIYDLLFRSFKATNQTIASFGKVMASRSRKDNLLQLSMQPYHKFLAELNSRRALLQEAKISETDAFFYYSDLVASLVEALSKLVHRAQNHSSISFMSMMRIIELEEQIKSVVYFILRRQILDVERYEGFLQLTAIRDYLLNLWKSTSPSNYVEYYEATLAKELNHSSVVEAYILESSIGSTMDRYIAADWRSNTTGKIRALRKVETHISSRIESSARSQFGSAVALIVIVVALILVCLALASCTSIVLSFSIVAPWRRLNILQRVVLAKFLPQPFLKLLGFTDATDITVGHYVEREDLTVVNVRVVHMGAIARKMKLAQMFEFSNAYLSFIGPFVRKHHGFIQDYSYDGFLSVFKNPKDAMLASIELQIATEAFNQNYAIHGYPHIMVAIVSDCGPMLVGLLGEEERLSPAILSSQSQKLSLMSQLADHLETNILTTLDAIQRSSKLSRHVNYRIIGQMDVIDDYDNENGEKEVVTVVEVIRQSNQEKMKTKEVFEKAVQYFLDEKLFDAQELFEQVLEDLPKDRVCKLYLNKMKQPLKELRELASLLTVNDILVDDVLLKDFEVFCQKEHSTENITLWKEIQQFRNTTLPDDRWKQAQRIRSEYLCLGGSSTINTNRQLLDPLLEKLSTCESIDLEPLLFDPVQIELEILMSDTAKRFLKSQEYFKSFSRSKRFSCPQYEKTLQ